MTQTDGQSYSQPFTAHLASIRVDCGEHGEHEDEREEELHPYPRGRAHPWGQGGQPEVMAARGRDDPKSKVIKLIITRAHLRIIFQIVVLYHVHNIVLINVTNININLNFISG
jgi:hypothetical protein